MAVCAKKIVFVGNALPRRCGIATFTTELHKAVVASPQRVGAFILAMNDEDQSHAYGPDVAMHIPASERLAYRRAADFIDQQGYDLVCLQHEFGIFGGEAGDYILDLVARLRVPLVTTFHTVLEEPNDAQLRVIRGLLRASAKVIVMAERARDVLQRRYQAPLGMIEFIPHGVPDVVFDAPDAAKDAMGFSGRSVILTFGLLAPNKGIEYMIDAMPSIALHAPDAVYVVLGATHPALVRREGEAYRERLVARAEERGVADRVVFDNRFVDQAQLLQLISMCDVYVTPYLNVAQMTSGTLAYSFGLGKAIVSTPYWHAQELLADGRGVLVPFADSDALGAEVGWLLADSPKRDCLRARAYASSRAMTWRVVAERYLNVFTRARLITLPGRPRGIDRANLPALSFTHLHALCDDTGLFQHAVRSVPHRAHGYCVDDNARGLLLLSDLEGGAHDPALDRLRIRLISFVHHAWNADTGRFRNFMGYDRRWLEEEGSEDSHGRCLWALGAYVGASSDRSLKALCNELIEQGVTVVESFSSPRAWAFTLLGLCRQASSRSIRPSTERLMRLFGARLLSLLRMTETEGWIWFEPRLSYDNARLPQALIETGRALGSSVFVEAGLRTLKWLVRMQTAPSGCFRPIGSSGFEAQPFTVAAFDQQPLEAAATLSACLAAFQADDDPSWSARGRSAFAWFLGENDLKIALVDPKTGSCCDGLHPDRANDNRGAESALSYLLALKDALALGALCDAAAEADYGFAAVAE
jgi:glycosyltransferase involved in cell wall biosynthesis